MEKKTGAFSYKEINHLDYSPDVISNVEVINIIRDKKAIVLNSNIRQIKLTKKV